MDQDVTVSVDFRCASSAAVASIQAKLDRLEAELPCIVCRARIATETEKALLTVCERNWPIENCVVFCADIYRAAGFADPIAAYRGTYRTEAEAYARMGLFGVAGLHARVAKAMGWERIDGARAQDGDWGLGHTNAGPTSCIRYRGAWVNSRIGGFALLDARQMIAAWKVC